MLWRSRRSAPKEKPRTSRGYSTGTKSRRVLDRPTLSLTVAQRQSVLCAARQPTCARAPACKNSRTEVSGAQLHHAARRARRRRRGVGLDALKGRPLPSGSSIKRAPGESAAHQVNTGSTRRRFLRASFLANFSSARSSAASRYRRAPRRMSIHLSALYVSHGVNVSLAIRQASA